MSSKSPSLSATVLLDSLPRQGLRAALAQADPALSLDLEAEIDTPQILMGRCGINQFTLMAVNGPYPAAELQHLCANSALFGGTWDKVRGTSAHVLITLAAADPARPSTKDEALFVARMAAALGGAGVLWGPADCVFPGAFFREQTARCAKLGAWPIMNTVTLQRFDHPAGWGLATRGLKPFVGYEIGLVAAPATSLPELADRVFGFCNWVLDARPSFKNGDTLGGDANSVAFRVRQLVQGDGTPTFLFEPCAEPRTNAGRTAPGR